MTKPLRGIAALTLALMMLVTGVGAQYAAVATTTVNNLRIRKEPGTQSAILATVSKGTKVTVLHEEQICEGGDAWYMVTYGSHTGYMSARYLDVQVNLGNEEGAALRAVTEARVNFRTEPSLKSKVIQVLAKGLSLELLATEGEWYKVSYDGKTGYVNAEYITLSAAAVVTGSTAASTYDYTGSSTTKRDIQAATETMAAVTTNDTQRSLLQIAIGKLGSPYAYGSGGPKSFDCSGFTSYVFKQMGISISRSSLDQYRLSGKAVESKAALQPGDLVFFRDTKVSKKAVTHVGLYIGQGLFIHSGSGNSGAGKCVKVSQLSTDYYAKVYVGAKRVI